MQVFTFLTVRPDSLRPTDFAFDVDGVYKGSAEPLLPPGLISAFLFTPFLIFGGPEDELRLILAFAG